VEQNIWNYIMTAAIAVIGFMAKQKMDHIDDRFNDMERLNQLLNKTREQLARDYVTRAEINQTLDKLADRIDASILRLETKIDAMGKEYHG